MFENKNLFLIIYTKKKIFFEYKEHQSKFIIRIEINILTTNKL